MTKRKILEKRRRKAKRKAAKEDVEMIRAWGSAVLTEEEKAVLTEEEKAAFNQEWCSADRPSLRKTISRIKEMMHRHSIMRREAVNEILDRHRGRIEAWAAVLTEEEKAAIDQELSVEYIFPQYFAHLNESEKLATIIDSYELCFQGEGFRFSEESAFITDNGEIDFSKTFTVADLIAETHLFDCM